MVAYHLHRLMVERIGNVVAYEVYWHFQGFWKGFLTQNVPLVLMKEDWLAELPKISVGWYQELIQKVVFRQASGMSFHLRLS